MTPVVESSLAGTQLWGEVDSVVDVDREAMLQLVRFVCDRHVV